MIPFIAGDLFYIFGVIGKTSNSKMRISQSFSHILVYFDKEIHFRTKKISFDLDSLKNLQFYNIFTTSTFSISFCN